MHLDLRGALGRSFGGDRRFFHVEGVDASRQAFFFLLIVAVWGLKRAREWPTGVRGESVVAYRGGVVGGCG